MENEIIDKKDLPERITIFFKEKKKIIFILLAILIGAIFSFFSFEYYKNVKNQKISEKFIKASIYLGTEDKEKSKVILKEIVESNSQFYSILALNTIIENDLEKSSNEILRLFKVLENIKIDKEQKNLIKLKKALYFIKISNEEEGNNLLKEIISENSIWKDVALEISK